MKLINIGFGSLIAAGRVLAVVDPDSAPIKRVVQEARDRGMLIDASYGRKTKAVILMDTDHVILSALTPDIISIRMIITIIMTMIGIYMIREHLIGWRRLLMMRLKIIMMTHSSIR